MIYFLVLVILLVETMILLNVYIAYKSKDYHSMLGWSLSAVLYLLLELLAHKEEILNFIYK